MKAWQVIVGVGLVSGGCSAQMGGEDLGSEGTTSVSSGGPSATTVAAGTTTSSGSSGGPQAGTLTAGAWDDNRNYDFFLDYVAKSPQLSGLPVFSDQERDAAHELSLLPPNARELLDVALVIDTTGSMEDEIAYLQTEFLALTDQIGARYPMAAQRWALVVYRDIGDEYVTRSSDFSDDLIAYQADLATQSAAGGGDYPEAPEAALEATMQLTWRAGDNARLVFWVGDAPHHSGSESRLVDAVHSAVAQQIHIYPVAASGTDDLMEYSMRSTAQLTGGRYLFLTDDSGVGNPHKEPNIPCYYVTRLDHAILRMVDIEMTGVYREPEPAQIIRTGGDPKDGHCTLENGDEVIAF